MQSELDSGGMAPLGVLKCLLVIAGLTGEAFAGPGMHNLPQSDGSGPVTLYSVFAVIAFFGGVFWYVTRPGVREEAQILKLLMFFVVVLFISALLS